MKVLDYLFKTDHTGQRRPSFLLLLIIVIGVFGSYFISNDSEQDSQMLIKSDPIIDYQDISSNPTIHREKGKSEDLIKPLLFTKPIRQPMEKPKKLIEIAHVKKPKVKSNTQVTVYDNTLASRNMEKEVKIPLGSMVECLLIHNIITNNFSSPVIVQVKKDFYFNGRLLFPKNTRIFGEARAGRERDRVLVGFKTILFDDGYEVRFQGRGLDFDGSGGFKSEIITEKTKEKILTKVIHFIGGTLLGLQEKSTNTLTGINQIDVTSRNAILEGSAKALTEEAKRLEKEINEAKGYGIVPAGAEVILYVDESFNIIARE